MATLLQLRTRVDAWLADKWPTVVARQDNYLANRGHYWQGLLTHTIVPTHTNSVDGDAVPDRLVVHPTDVFEDWKTAFPEWDGVNIPAALKIDVYDGPQGKGWCATIYIRYNGTLYSRSRNVGPESERTEAWHVVDESQ
jgi:hypothetical protein